MAFRNGNEKRHSIVPMMKKQLVPSGEIKLIDTAAILENLTIATAESTSVQENSTAFLAPVFEKIQERAEKVEFVTEKVDKSPMKKRTITDKVGNIRNITLY